MKIGYPCINRSLNCSSSRTFRIKNYSDDLLIEIVSNNIRCLEKILLFNKNNNILFLRVSSDLVPFASHPICKFNWQKYFSKDLGSLGKFINKYNMRISMHPDQFVLINSIRKDVLNSSIRELCYHSQVLELMGLNKTAKIQIHVGGVYGNKKLSIKRFIKRYGKLDSFIKKRLVIENDDKGYSFSDCLQIYEHTGIPVVFDVLHDQINNSGQYCLSKSLELWVSTWKKNDGLPILDYSLQAPGKIKGAHINSINIQKFQGFLKLSKNLDFDIMLEIKDKEKSALEAVQIAKRDYRFKVSNP